MQRAHARASWVLNGFGGGGPRYAANPGLTPSFRCSLPETGCLSQGLPYGKRFAWPCPPKTVKHPRVSSEEGPPRRDRQGVGHHGGAYAAGLIAGAAAEPAQGAGDDHPLPVGEVAKP